MKLVSQLTRGVVLAMAAVCAMVIPVAAGVTSASAGAPYTCVSTQAQGVSCGLPRDTTDFKGIPNAEGHSASTATEFDINQWNNGGGSSNYCNSASQKLKANSAEDWKIKVSLGPVPSGQSEGVCAYPNVWPHDMQGNVDSFTEAVASFTESFPHTTNVDAHGMEDDWFNNWAYEVMVQYDFSNDAPCEGSWPQTAMNLSFGGEYQVPTQKWHMCSSSDGKSIIFKLGASDASEGNGESSGKVDLGQMLRYAEAHNNPETGKPYLPKASGASSAQWTAFSMGFEYLNTHGVPTTFDVSRSTATFK